MDIKDKKEILEVWKSLMDSQESRLKETLSDLDHSALYDCLEDCYESLVEIYGVLIPSIQKSLGSKDFGKLDDAVIDMRIHFEHIKNHAIDAENGFYELSRQFGKQAEDEENK